MTMGQDTERLQALAEDLWMAEGPVVDFYGFPYPTRSVVIRLPSGGLWVWSPVPLDEELQVAVKALGEVTHLVSPNKLHHLGLDDWHAAWPEAALWGPPATVGKRDDLPFAGTLGDGPPAVWSEAVDQIWFRGSLLLDEVVFFHRPSCTVLIADLSENLTPAFLEAHWAPWKRWIASLWRITEPWGYAPLEIRSTTIRRRQARAAVQQMLDWNPRRVVMAHGAWINGDGRAYLERAFGWLL